MIEKKVKGQEIKAVPATPRRTGQVVDIFAALKKSLETAERPQRKATADQPKLQKEAVGPDGIQCNQHYQKNRPSIRTSDTPINHARR